MQKVHALLPCRVSAAVFVADLVVEMAESFVLLVVELAVVTVAEFVVVVVVVVVVVLVVASSLPLLVCGLQQPSFAVVDFLMALIKMMQLVVEVVAVVEALVLVLVVVEAVFVAVVVMVVWRFLLVQAASG